MSLIQRLIGEGPDETTVKLPILQFWASVREFQAGDITRTEFEARYNLDASERAELLEILTSINNLDFTVERIQDKCLLAERTNREGAKDDTAAKIRTRLGLMSR